MPADRPQIRTVLGKDLHVIAPGVDDVDGVFLPEVDQHRDRLEKLPFAGATASSGFDEVPLGIELLDARILRIGDVEPFVSVEWHEADPTERFPAVTLEIELPLAGSGLAPGLKELAGGVIDLEAPIGPVQHPEVAVGVDRDVGGEVRPSRRWSF
jgi:hypothetical protein